MAHRATRMPRPSMQHRCAILLFTFLVGCHTAAASTTIARQGDAAIDHDTSAGTWTLTAGGAALTLALDPTRDFAIVSLVSASGTPWTKAPAADSVVRIGNRTLPFGNRSAGFAYQDASVVTRGRTLQLNASFRLDAEHITLTRHYAIVPGSPSFETWTTYDGIGATFADLNALELTIPGGVLH